MFVTMAHTVYYMSDMSGLSQTIGMLVREARQGKQWQQQQLAVAVGLKRTSITNIEAGRQSITLELFCAIANALDQDPGELLRHASKMQSATTAKSAEEIVEERVGSEESDIKELILKTLQ